MKMLRSLIKTHTYLVHLWFGVCCATIPSYNMFKRCGHPDLVIPLNSSVMLYARGHHSSVTTCGVSLSAELNATVYYKFTEFDIDLNDDVIVKVLQRILGTGMYLEHKSFTPSSRPIYGRTYEMASSSHSKFTIQKHDTVEDFKITLKISQDKSFPGGPAHAQPKDEGGFPVWAVAVGIGVLFSAVFPFIVACLRKNDGCRATVSRSRINPKASDETRNEADAVEMADNSRRPNSVSADENPSIQSCSAAHVGSSVILRNHTTAENKDSSDPADEENFSVSHSADDNHDSVHSNTLGLPNNADSRLYRSSRPWSDTCLRFNQEPPPSYEDAVGYNVSQPHSTAIVLQTVNIRSEESHHQPSAPPVNDIP